MMNHGSDFSAFLQDQKKKLLFTQNHKTLENYER